MPSILGMSLLTPDGVTAMLLRGLTPIAVDVFSANGTWTKRN